MRSPSRMSHSLQLCASRLTARITLRRRSLSASRIIVQRAAQRLTALRCRSGRSAESARIICGSDCILGLLQPSGESYLYGYITSSGIKLIVVIKGTLPKEQDVRALFHKLHTGYTMLVRNPFYKPGSDINSSSFDTVVRSVMPATTTTA